MSVTGPVRPVRSPLPASRAARWRHEGEAVAAAALAVTLLVFGLPKVAGVGWGQVGAVLGRLTVAQVGLLTAVWLGGLAVQTVALAAALPGLSHRRAFFLNITGSAVSNLLPLGGAAGSAVNYWAVRGWGFGTPAFLRWALVTNIWDVLGRLAVPAVALGWFAASGTDSEVLTTAGLGAAATLLGLVVVTVVVLRAPARSAWVGRLLDRVATLVRRPPPPGTSYVERVVAAVASVADLVRGSWVRLTVGKLGYAVLQAVLLWLCLAVLGARPALVVVAGAFAVERLLSLAVISPAATGIVELGMTGLLVALGTDPAASAAGVLLYRLFVIGMEVPVGGALLGWWLLGRLRRRRRGARGGPSGQGGPGRPTDPGPTSL
jgi:uncharacterized membrane protein YbhN (UPF0104 family)